jgi:hypothetical protein
MTPTGAAEPGTSTPLPVAGIEGATALAVWHQLACAVVAGGRVRCWGEMGTGVFVSGLDAPTPREIEGLEGAVDVEVGGLLGCARRADGTVSCFGPGLDGEMVDDPFGHGPRARRARRDFIAPTDIAALRGAESIDLGLFGGCARITGGEVRCFEWAAPRPFAPRAIPTLRGAPFVEIDDDEACAVRRAGSLFCVRFTARPIVRDGTLGSRPGPRPVESVVDLAQAGAYRCVLHATGQVSCSGNLANGMLGDGTSDVIPSPRPVELPVE